MKKEFLPYDLEVKLVELGFNEKTFDVHSDGWTQGFKVVKKPTPRILFQQAFRFFRDRYHLIGCIDFHASYKNYMYNIKEFEYITHRTRIETYEEAELECLKKLIELAKEQNVK